MHVVDDVNIYIEAARDIAEYDLVARGRPHRVIGVHAREVRQPCAGTLYGVPFIGHFDGIKVEGGGQHRKVLSKQLEYMRSAVLVSKIGHEDIRSGPIHLRHPDLEDLILCNT